MIIEKRPKVDYKWQATIVASVEQRTNLELLTDTLWLGGGDDYDGAFTNRGAWEYEYYQWALQERLGDWLEG